MASDPDGLWPRLADEDIDAPDEEREVGDVEAPVDEEAVVDLDEHPRIDADDRPVDIGDRDDDADERVDEDERTGEIDLGDEVV